jgi:type I restriction enzyme S subunit
MSEDVTLEEFVNKTDNSENEGAETSESWREVSLIDLCEMGGGSTPKKSNPDYWRGGDILWTTPKDFDSPRLQETQDKITEKGAQESTSRIYPEGTTLLVVRSGVLRHTLPVAFVEEPTTINQDLKALEPDRNQINPEYLFQAISGLSEDIRGSCKKTGTTVESIQTNVLKQYPVPVPPFSEQHKIATILFTIDQAIEKTDDVLQQTKRVQQGVEQRLFQEGFFNYTDIEEKRLVKMPKDWDFDQLSEHTLDSAFGPRFGSERYDEGGNIATLRTTDLDDQGHISLDTMPVADLEQSEVEEHLLEPGDFIITRSGTTGIGTVWEGYDTPTIPGAFLIRFRLKDTLYPNFLKYYVNSSIGRRRVNRRAKGGVQKNLAGSDLLNMRFPIPNKEEQRKIIEVLDTLEERIQHEHKYKSQLKRLKQSLQQDLLSGKVRTTDTNIEVPDKIAQYD